MTVTEDGFEPADLTVSGGQPVTLVITRTTDATCATEIEIDDPPVSVKLPLDETVEVTFTPTKTGAFRYGCAMRKMVGGVITVR